MAALLTGCGGSQAGGPGGFQRGGGPPSTSVETAPVQTGSISDQIRSFGTIQAQDVVTIMPQISNRVTHIHADLGDTVQQGDLLATIYDVPYRDELAQAEAQLRQNRTIFARDSVQYERQRLLHESSAISSSEFDEARAAFESSRAQYEAARAALTQSRENLANTEIRSPVYGVVLDRMIAEGDIAGNGQAAFEVANLVGFETRLHLPLQDWELVTVGLPVEMRLSNRGETVAEGVVSRISPQLQPDTGLGEVVVSLTDATSSVRQGVLVESRITLITHENTIIIPRSAIIEQVETYIEPETNSVELRRRHSAFVAVGDTIAEQRELTLGLEQGERVEVLTGLEPGEDLVITGQRSLADESRIRVAGRESGGRDDTLGEGQQSEEFQQESE